MIAAPRRAPAFALVIVLLSIGVLTTLLVGVQSISLRQSESARTTLARLRASWAARAGLESCIARLESGLQSGIDRSAYAILDDMEGTDEGSLDAATWSIRAAGAERDAELIAGPADPHAKLNVNLMTREELMLLEGMTEDVADSILDWIDEDDTPRPLGAEAGFYSQLPSPYEPRNGPVRSLFELELVAGVDPALLRGEDWDLDGDLEPSEDDGDASFPPDNADGLLDAGWSAFITATSIEPSIARSGEPRLVLAEAAPEELAARIPNLRAVQAQTLIDLASSPSFVLEDLVSQSLSAAAAANGVTATNVPDLTDAQRRSLFDECTLDALNEQPQPGKINLNTVSRETLDYVLSLPAGIADSIILARDSAPSGFTNIMDLLEVPSVTGRRARALARRFTVDPGVYCITSVGRDSATGFEVRIHGAVRAATLPVTIEEHRAR